MLVGQVGEVPDLQMSVHVPTAAAAPAKASTREERSIDGESQIEEWCLVGKEVTAAGAALRTSCVYIGILVRHSIHSSSVLSAAVPLHGVGSTTCTVLRCTPDVGSGK